MKLLPNSANNDDEINESIDGIKPIKFDFKKTSVKYLVEVYGSMKKEFVTTFKSKHFEPIEEEN